MGDGMILEIYLYIIGMLATSLIFEKENIHPYGVVVACLLWFVYIPIAYLWAVYRIIKGK